MLGGEHGLAEEGKVLTGATLGKAQEEKAVISTAMANPETTFSERDIFTRFLRSGRGSRKSKASGGGQMRDEGQEKMITGRCNGFDRRL